MDNLPIAGGLVNCALFLVFVFVAAVMSANHLACALCVASSGLAVLSYAHMIANPNRLLNGFGLTSNVAAVVAFGMVCWGWFA